MDICPHGSEFVSETHRRLTRKEAMGLGDSTLDYLCPRVNRSGHDMQSLLLVSFSATGRQRLSPPYSQGSDRVVFADHFALPDTCHVS